MSIAAVIISPHTTLCTMRMALGAASSLVPVTQYGALYAFLSPLPSCGMEIRERGVMMAANGWVKMKSHLAFRVVTPHVQRAGHAGNSGSVISAEADCTQPVTFESSGGG